MPIPAKKMKDKPKTAKQRVYSELKKWIIEGVMQPGEKISDQEIALYFSVSRTPVREAIQMLADQKLITIMPGKMSYISPIDVCETISAYKIEAELHSLALELAFPKITDEVIAELERANENFHHAFETGDFHEITNCDNKFHNIILKLSGSSFIKEFIVTVGSHIQRIEHIYFQTFQNSKNSYHEHNAVIRALKKRDLAAAQKNMRINWLHSIEILEEINL